MRGFRNPRYAPESLERKLSPSGFAPIAVAAQVYVPTSPSSSSILVVDATIDGDDDADSVGTVLACDIPEGDGEPPVAVPSAPSGPVQPA